MASEHGIDPPAPSLADKINQAFETLHPADRGPYTNAEVAQWFVDHGERGEPAISVNYIGMLRSGKRTNPTLSHLRALARFFRVPATYFLEDSADSAAVHQDLKMVAAMRDADVREIAARAMELDPSMREWLRNTVAGLPGTGGASRRRARRFQAPDPGGDGGDGGTGDVGGSSHDGGSPAGEREPDGGRGRDNPPESDAL